MAQPQSALRALDQSYMMGIGQGPAPARVPRTRGQSAADMLGAAAIGTTPIPIVGDITGLAADAAMYAAYPEERTMGNYAMSAAGVLPFVPGVSALRALRDAPSVNLIDDGKGKALIMSEGKQAGVIEYEINNGAVQIKGSEVNPSRSGIGTEAYKQFINSKMDEGLSVGSDNIVSQQAEGLYKKLASQGYQITENPSNTRIYPGSLTSVSRESRNAQRSAHPTVYSDGARQTAPGFVLRGDPVYQITGRPPAPSPLEGTLDMSQAARMQRAAEQGFNVDRPVYHSTDKDFSEFKLPDDPNFQKLGQGVYTSPKPSYGERYVKDYKTGQLREGANVMPLLSRGRLASPDDYEKAFRQVGFNVSHDPRQREIQSILRDQGFTGIDMNGEVLIFDPVNLRSVNAAFDPTKRGSSNLMAGAAGATIGLSALRNIQRDEEPQPD